MRLALRISKTPTAWRWYREDKDLAGDQVLESSGSDYLTWQEAKAAAIAAHPSITRIDVNAVRGYGVLFEDSLGMSQPLGGERVWLKRYNRAS